MKKLLFYILLITCSTTYSQDTLFVDSKDKITPVEEAKYYKIIKPDSLNKKWTTVDKYLMDGTLHSIRTIENYNSKKEKNISYFRYYENGSVKRHLFISKENKKHFYWTSYWENGTKKREDIYKGKMEGKLISGKCWDKNGDLIPYYDVWIKPIFSIGDKNDLNRYLVNEIKKNDIPYKKVSGQKVKISFVIDVDGSIADVEMLEGTNDPHVNYWTVKTIMEMPNWTPGKYDGEPIRVRYRLPVRF